MKNVLIPTLALGCLAAQPLLAQRADPANSLARARAVFDLADVNKDGKLDFDEISKQRLPIKKSEFDAIDVDKSASWSRDEFLVYYRRLLLANRQKPAVDLESEVTRVEASRKAKEAETKRTVAPAATGVAATAEGATDLETKLQLALDDLEKKAALRQATRADFDHVRDAWTARAQAATAQDPVASAELKKKFEDAMSALEVQAKQGNYSREEYNALREQYIARGRNAANQNASSTAGDPDAALQSALDDLDRKAQARQATHEDFTRVRDASAARAKAASAGADPTAVAQDAALAQKFQTAMDELEKDALAGNWSREKFDAVRQSYIHRARAANGAVTPAPAATSGDAASVQKRFEEALNTLETRALARGATREDYQRVKDLLVEHARHSVNAADGANGASPAAADDPRVTALAAKLGAAIDQLEEQARAGKITREDFDNLRQMYIGRARAAANTETGEKPAGTNPVQGAGPTGPGSRAQPNKPTDTGTPAAHGPGEGRRAEKENQTPPAPAPAPAPTPTDKPKPDDGSGGREKPPPHRG